MRSTLCRSIQNVPAYSARQWRYRFCSICSSEEPLREHSPTLWVCNGLPTQERRKKWAGRISFGRQSSLSGCVPTGTSMGLVQRKRRKMKRKTYSNRPRSGFSSDATKTSPKGDWSKVRIGLLLTIGIFPAYLYCWAISVVFHHVRVALELNSSKRNSAQLKGEEWQKGNQQRGSLIRSGGSLNSDDLRHRLNELRSSKSGGPERRTPKIGGHYAKQ